jgi:hypothetical protein
MSSPSREHLLGFLLGALERTEQEQVEAELDQNPALRAELDRLEGCIGRLGLDEEPQPFDPPVGLATRTCRFVAVQSERQVTLAATSRAANAIETGRKFRWLDLAVAAAVLVAVSSLFFPALSYSRFQSHVTTCQNQLRLIGQGLHDFSELQPDGSFPGPEASGNRAAAGVVAPLLVSNRLVSNSGVFLCPSSQIIRRAAGFQVPSLEELDLATGVTLVALQRRMGGDYGYNMGYARDEKLVKPCNSRREDYVLVGDAPSDLQPGRVSGNHHGRGQNVLYEDGHVKFVVQVEKSRQIDDPFHNREGWVAAGVDGDDAVLGASADHPFPMLPINP